mmetsp:Transcript_31495/g.43843  ORF Transcript_31495/g.43843 Transcript_31495/m.43843 type:complete len:266 (+) Transcript_31495:169-966(+)|eukprot:CAMPEP_0185267042 /NCGR_PEP_ID=MMETSP1359-20130426/33188_1 /TAXON_ID=552665 /ORGANISM="Bigelowiella longifila, Strain CCMP242" /LENGTH=265 /DNA_ID=CAMNT_0027857213 /DNA_START=93 /DNA_END=890 /DNA_ORIENTATION=-
MNSNASINSHGSRSKLSLHQEQPLLAEEEEEDEKVDHRSNQDLGGSSISSNTQITSKARDYELNKDSLPYLKEWPTVRGNDYNIENVGIDNDYMVTAAASSSQERGNWSSGLIDFYQDPLTCCYGCVCPALLFADNVAMTAHHGGEGGWWEAACTHVGTDALSLLWLSCVWPLIIPIPFSVPQRVRQRFKIRKYLNIRGSLLEDVFVHLCCYPCALSQEYRQALEIRRIPILDDDPGHPPPPDPIIAAAMEQQDPAGGGIVGPMA